MEDWALMDDDRPAPRWLVYALTVAAVVAAISLILMAAAVALFLLVPSAWLP